MDKKDLKKLRSDFGVSFFVGEDAEQQAKEYEQALAERNKKL